MITAPTCLRWKLTDGYDAWRAENIRQSRFLQDAAKQPEYLGKAKRLTVEKS